MLLHKKILIVEMMKLRYDKYMKNNLIHYRTSVCNINYHIVLSVKYRRKILDEEIELFLKKLVLKIARKKGFIVHLFECGEKDHVHCFVTAPPKMSVSIIVKHLKGITARKLYEEFPEIRNKLWKDRYGIILIIVKQSVLFLKIILKDI